MYRYSEQRADKRAMEKIQIVSRNYQERKVQKLLSSSRPCRYSLHLPVEDRAGVNTSLPWRPASSQHSCRQERVPKQPSNRSPLLLVSLAIICCPPVTKFTFLAVKALSRAIVHLQSEGKDQYFPFLNNLICNQISRRRHTNLSALGTVDAVP